MLERKTLENVPFSDKRNFNQTNQWNFQILAKSYTRFPTKETIFFFLSTFLSTFLNSYQFEILVKVAVILIIKKEEINAYYNRNKKAA